MAHSTITLSSDNWEFILDSLNDRLENLVEINTGPYGIFGELDEDIRHCESIIAAIEKRK